MKSSQAPLLPLRVTVLTVLVGVVCEGDVSWSGTAAELSVALGQERAVVEFAFRNSGQQPLRFTSLRPSSDCVTAAASNEAFTGGEMVAMRVEFIVGGRSGWQEKFGTVRSRVRPALNAA